MNKKKEEFKPCPFCGPKGKPQEYKSRGVKCGRCKSWGPDPMDPRVDWNTRAGIDVVALHSGEAEGTAMEVDTIAAALMVNEVFPEARKVLNEAAAIIRALDVERKILRTKLSEEKNISEDWKRVANRIAERAEAETLR